MIIENSADLIGKYNFSHWTGKPIMYDEHVLALIPKSITDGWKGYCSCGEWSAFASFDDIPTRDRLLEAIRDEHRKHVSTLDPTNGLA